jgi:hypothetical protein
MTSWNTNFNQGIVRVESCRQCIEVISESSGGVFTSFIQSVNKYYLLPGKGYSYKLLLKNFLEIVSALVPLDANGPSVVSCPAKREATRERTKSYSTQSWRSTARNSPPSVFCNGVPRAWKKNSRT